MTPEDYYRAVIKDLTVAHAAAIKAAYTKGVQDGMEAQRRVDEVFSVRCCRVK